MTYDLPSPAFIGTAPCSPRVSESAAPPAAGVASVAVEVAPKAAAEVPFQSSRAVSQGAFDGSDIAVDGHEIAGCSANQCPESREGDVSGSIPERSTNYLPPAGYVLISRVDIERAMDLIAECAEWKADYLRLRELERVELLLPPASFLANPDFSRAMER